MELRIYYYENCTSIENQTCYENFILQKFGAIWYVSRDLETFSLRDLVILVSSLKVSMLSIHFMVHYPIREL